MSLPVLDLDPTFNGSAWRALLSPSSSLELLTPGIEQLAAEGIGVSEQRLDDVRRFALAAVLKPSQETISAQGRLLANRLAGAGVLTVLHDPAYPKSPSDAWVSVEWKTSTSTLASWAARQLDMAAPGAVARLAAIRAAVLVHPERSALLEGELADRLVKYGAVFGLDLVFLDRSKASRGSIVQSLRRERPPILIALGPVDDDTEALIGEFVDPRARGVLRIDSTHSGELEQVFRDGIAQVSGVSASLRIIGADDAEFSSDTGSRTPPVADPVECLHDGSHRYYLRDAATDLWWTPDTAGHAGAVFKTYRRVGDFLRHNACHDQNGTKIDKFKGEVGREIAVGSLHGCEDPWRHVRRDRDQTT